MWFIFNTVENKHGIEHKTDERTYKWLRKVCFNHRTDNFYVQIDYKFKDKAIAKACPKLLIYDGTGIQTLDLPIE